MGSCLRIGLFSPQPSQGSVRTPLEAIARGLILSGEYVGAIDVQNGGLRLNKATRGTSPGLPIHGAGSTPLNYRGLRAMRPGAFRQTG